MPIRNPNCSRCDLHKTAKTVCIAPDGPRDARILFVGDAPSAEEDRMGIPFQGKSGQLIRKEIARAGIDVNSIRFTNVVRCRPHGKDSPTKEQLKACSIYLENELAATKPEYVIALGAMPMKSVFKKVGITEHHGKVIEDSKFAFKGMPIFHPDYAFRDPSKLAPIRQDLERLQRELDGQRKEDKIDWKFLTQENLSEFVEQFEACEAFAFDTETTGLLPHHPEGKIRTLQIAMDSGCWVIRLNMRDSVMPKHQTQYKFCQWLQQAAKGKWTAAANGKFDNSWLSCMYGISFYLNFDVGLAHHILDENTPHGLKEMSRTYIDAPDYDLPLAHLMHPEEHGVLDKFYDYSARDPFYTLKLARVFDSMLKKDRWLRRLFYKLVMPLARALQIVEMEGITINLGKMAAMESEVTAKLIVVEKELNEMACKAGAKEAVNWGSPAQVAKFLFSTLKLTPTVLTAGGAPSTGEEALINIKDQHPIANKLFEFRELSKFLSTYLIGWKEYMVREKVYFSCKIHGTVTGRASSRLHQTPRDGTIRNLVEAPPNYSFVQGDLSQAELRIAAEISGDPEMIRCFNKGIDIHWRTLLFVIQSGGAGSYYEVLMDTASTLRRLNGPHKKIKMTDIELAIAVLLEHGHQAAIAISKSWKEGRQLAKAVNFGLIFGMGWKKLIEYMKVKYGIELSELEAQTIHAAFFRLYSSLESWHRRQRGLVALDGYVRNLAGRMRRLPAAQSSDKFLRFEAERQAINSPVQGFIGDLKSMALTEIVETLPQYSVKVVGEVHDSILMNVRTSELDIWLPKVRQIMQNPKLLKDFNINLKVPIVADLEVGVWGAGKAYTQDLKDNN